MRVLVTGANGFVGAALCLRLSALGQDVVPAVRRQGGKASEQVILDDADWRAALRECDSVVHLAGRTHEPRSAGSDSMRVFREDNVTPTVQLAHRAVEAGVRRFVFMSTIKVNGERTAPGRRFTPDDPPDPADSYAVSKWEAETALLELGSRTGLEVVIIRPPIVYGPGVKGNFAALVRWVRSGVPLPFGAIQNRRSMIALENLIDFTSVCADVNASPDVGGQVLLPSDGEDVSTTELLIRVASAYRCRDRLFSAPVGLMRVAASLAGKSSLADRLFGSLVIDDSRARQLVRWRPPVTLDEQLRTMAINDGA